MSYNTNRDKREALKTENEPLSQARASTEMPQALIQAGSEIREQGNERQMKRGASLKRKGENQ
jgi:hypothetical protein